jgi:MFS family permease
LRTAIWLYFFLFIAFFDLHAQYPILTPFAVSLGAAPSFIGLIMGMYALTHLPGNLLAGIWVDRYGSRLFIAASMIGAGLLLLLQARVTDPWHLLYIRSVSGFVLAFLSPACMALLARLARTHFQQGKLMAGNGMVNTIASVVSPAAGAYLAATIGFSASFTILGWVLLITGAASLAFIREPQKVMLPDGDSPARQAGNPKAAPEETGNPSLVPQETGKFPWIVFVLPVAMACAQGILSFELPLRAKTNEDVLEVGILFSVISLGALITLGMLFLNRYLPYVRTVGGLAMLASSYYVMAMDWPLPLAAVLFALGMAKGILFPAVTSLLLQLSGASRYGRTFSIMSICLSIGSFLGPVAAGALRDHVSPFFLAFAVLMTALLLLYPRQTFQKGWHGNAALPRA